MFTSRDVVWMLLRWLLLKKVVLKEYLLNQKCSPSLVWLLLTSKLYPLGDGPTKPTYHSLEAATKKQNKNKNLSESLNNPWRRKTYRRRATTEKTRKSSKTNSKGQEDNVHKLKMDGWVIVWLVGGWKEVGEVASRLRKRNKEGKFTMRRDMSSLIEYFFLIYSIPCNSSS
jgi:hypothetical protein